MRALVGYDALGDTIRSGDWVEVIAGGSRVGQRFTAEQASSRGRLALIFGHRHRAIIRQDDVLRVSMDHRPADAVFTQQFKQWIRGQVI